MIIRRAAGLYGALVLVLAPVSLLHAQSAGSLKTAQGVFEFTPAACAIYKEDDFYDIEVHGPGTSPDGEIVYFEFSSTAQSLNLSFGVDSVFASSDTTLQSAGEMQIEVDDRKIRVTNLTLVDQNGATADTDASLEIDCA